MSKHQDGTSGLKYIPSTKWRRFGKPSFRNARSLSRTLNSLFHRKNSYSFLKSNKKNLGTFEIINCTDSQGVSIAPLRSPSSSHAQVWGVRHSYTKSAVEDLQFSLDLEQSTSSDDSHVKPKEAVTSVPRDNNNSDIVIGSYKDSGIATSDEAECKGNKLDTSKANVSLTSQGETDIICNCDNEKDGVIQDTDVESTAIQLMKNDCLKSSGIESRDRLQSFGSSQCYSDSLSCSQGCSYSSSPRERSISMSDDWASIDSLDSLDNVSYWDLPIIDKGQTPDNSLRGFPMHRRYSESMVKTSRLADGSPRRRTEIAHRRMSESISGQSGSLYRRSPRLSDRRDSFTLRKQLLTIPQGQECCHELSQSVESSPAAIPDTQSSTLPRTRQAHRKRSSSDFGLRLGSKKSSTLPRSRSMLSRSRSADFRKSHRQQHDQRTAISDIGSSDESPTVESKVGLVDVDLGKIADRYNKPISLTSSSKSDESEESKDGRERRRESKSKSHGTKSTQLTNNCTTKMKHSDSVEFLPVKDLMFCSGEHGTVDSRSDDLDKVIEAVQAEADKVENAEKDMMVMFLVGGELKVLRRAPLAGHGEIKSFSDLPSMTKKDSFTYHNGSHNYSYGHAVHEANRGRPKSAVIITRSQSFAGMAHPPTVQRRDGPQAVVLGESFRHHRSGQATIPQHSKSATGSRGATGFSFKKSPKVPKVPRPNRALLMFQSVKRGIREFIDATKDDIFQLQQREPDGTSTAQGKVHEADKQLKSAERYMKRLEFHLAKLDELHEYYLLQQQLREGVRTMHRAYVSSSSTKGKPLSNVKYGYKECTQTMCNIEAQLEAMMGTFNCKLKGIAGFARLCPGDVFEVTVRHGTQKWKTKGRIEKSGNQKWDIPDFNFKAVVGDVINIKGVEVRPFKSVLLGQKSCETKDLFSANPQLMTVSINVNGSLKLSIVMIWNPLDGVDESFTFVDTPLRSQHNTPRRTRPVSVLALNGQYNEYDQFSQERRLSSPVTTVQKTKDDNFILRTNAPHTVVSDNVTSYHGLDSPHVAARHSEHLPAVYQATSGPILSQTYGHVQAGFHSNPVLTGDLSSAQSLTNPANRSSVHSSVYPSSFSHLHFPTMTSHVSHTHENGEDTGVVNIEDVLHNISSSLEDYHGQYLELQKLEELVKLAQKLMRKQFRNSSRSSSISVSIESALEAFDFLDTEDTLEEPESPARGSNNTKSSFDDLLCSPESTAKTADSGIESLAQRLSEDHTQLSSSLDSSPTPPTTGNEEVDQCLIYHLTYCERLLENLGAFGPLKCHEIYALDKLQKQTNIVDSLLKLAKSGSEVDLHSVMSSLCEDKSLREFWVKCTDQNSLYIDPDKLVTALEQKFSHIIHDNYMLDPNKVCKHVMTRVLDIPDYDREKGRSTFILTLHQFMTYFTEEGGLKHVEEVASEMKLVERLTSGNPDIVIKAILSLRDTLPSSPCLKVIGMLLVTMDTEVEQCTISYLNLIQKRQGLRDKAMVVFVEGLEDQTPEIRAGACAALGILEASESTDQLVYLWQSDNSALVQQRAKTTLLSLGEDGKKAFEDAQLSKHGFQGIQVHK